ncbi:MAG: hypothetical protein ACI9MC_000885 [Kiritimatiellia bacterium]|jgi:hypothetical protein
MSDQSVRVAIIGGGPSGWAAAEALRHDRWNQRFDVTVYERNDYFGGKCRTVFTDGGPCNGKPGGYELGAGVLSKGSANNADLERLLDLYALKTHDIAEKNRQKYRFYNDGSPITARDAADLALRHPITCMRVLWGLVRYRVNLWRYSRAPQLDYHGRPGALNRPFSDVYPQALNALCCFGMQGFGYADTDDEGLTPALLYYHQYATPDVIINPVYSVDNGMQALWSTIAATYQPGRARLNAQVVQVTRSEGGVQVQTKGDSTDYDYLIVAVPLGPALRFLDLDEADELLIDRVRTNHYVTVLCRARGLVDIAHVHVRNASQRSGLGGVVFAYKRYPDSDWITVNLYVNADDPPSDVQIVDIVERDLRAGMGAELIERQAASVYHWPDYFPHLAPEDLNAGWYSKFERQMQGRRRTLFVSSGLHMETVGASVQYATAKTTQIAERWLGDNTSTPELS